MLLSAALIVKNEERCIIRCLESIEADVDEIIVVDTGSTDRTMQLVRAFADHSNKPVQLHDVEWADDFSAARNFALSKASGQFVISIDADEYLHSEDRGKLHAYCTQLDGQPALINVNIVNVAKGQTLNTFGLAARIFARNAFAWSGIIHESLTPLVSKITRGKMPIRLIHDGYDDSVINRNTKKTRNLKLLSRRIKEDANDFWAIGYIASEMVAVDLAKSREYILLAEKIADGRDNNFTEYMKGVKQSWNERKIYLDHVSNNK